MIEASEARKISETKLKIISTKEFQKFCSEVEDSIKYQVNNGQRVYVVEYNHYMFPKLIQELTKHGYTCETSSHSIVSPPSLTIM